ncbi:type II secretion system protein [Dethiobacter alkaliphilus]|uniref:type II secretion system protein n=1 Tax=Dethiobacter alkaliphilus TaxID=427926 RepID=UPI0022262DF4|nr:hypothetical protein [Dethiobacter alkaliphilus]MCW3490340.1 hypothetical protein [Dethiobacter alkaliphilus]
MRLAELFIVLVILVTLSGTGITVYSEHIGTVQNSVLSYNVKVMQQAVEIYRLENGKYPDDLESLVENGYFREMPVNPVTGAADFDYDPVTGKIK